MHQKNQPISNSKEDLPSTNPQIEGELAEGPIPKAWASCPAIEWLHVFAFDVARPQPFINIILCSRGRDYSHADYWLAICTFYTLDGLYTTQPTTPYLPHPIALVGSCNLAAGSFGSPSHVLYSPGRSLSVLWSYRETIVSKRWPIGSMTFTARMQTHLRAFTYICTCYHTCNIRVLAYTCHPKK